MCSKYEAAMCEVCGGPRSPWSGQLCWSCFRIQVVFNKRARAGWPEDEVTNVEVTEAEINMIGELPKRKKAKA